MNESFISADETDSLCVGVYAILMNVVADLGAGDGDLSSIAPWYIVECGDRHRAHLNCITHLLSQIPYEEPPPREPVTIPERDKSNAFDDEGTLKGRNFVPGIF